MSGGNGRTSYSTAAIWLHWLIALAVIAQFVGIQYADGLEREDPAMGTVFMIHKSIGITILALTVLRLLLRLRQGFLPLPQHMAGWEIALARTTHIGFYALLLLMPLSGWIFGISAERGLDWFGLFPVPPLPLDGLKDAAHEFHEIGAWILLALFVFHLLGALKHHYLDRDDVLARMLPVIRRR